MKRGKLILALLHLLAVLVALAGFYVFSSKRDFRIQTTQPSTSSSVSSSTTASSSEEKDVLPAVSPDDWELRLVNRDHAVGDVVPDLGYVAGIPVDQRIVEATSKFMEAVHALDPDPLQGLYSGYRSVAEQETLIQTRIAEAVAEGMSEEEAAATVSQTVLPAGYSEHHTGLAIDIMRMSDVADKIAAMAPEHGFILRYTESGQAKTGVAPEDWHYRYVGVASAKYMTEHQLTLEEYIELLRSKNR